MEKFWLCPCRLNEQVMRKMRLLREWAAHLEGQSAYIASVSSASEVGGKPHGLQSFFMTLLAYTLM